MSTAAPVSERVIGIQSAFFFGQEKIVTYSDRTKRFKKRLRDYFDSCSELLFDSLIDARSLGNSSFSDIFGDGDRLNEARNNLAEAFDFDSQTIKINENNVLEIHENLLIGSLSVFLYNTKRTREGLSAVGEKRDVLEWMFEPDILFERDAKGREILIRTEDIPFSFNRCCRVCGYDPEALRDLFEGMLRRRGITVPQDL